MSPSASRPAAARWAAYSKSTVKPNLFVDGRQYIVYWGQVTVEVPADRPVRIGVGMQDGIRGASLLLPPGTDAVVLDYHVPAMGEVASGRGCRPEARGHRTVSKTWSWTPFA